jgi:hypothetical protein
VTLCVQREKCRVEPYRIFCGGVATVTITQMRPAGQERHERKGARRTPWKNTQDVNPETTFCAPIVTVGTRSGRLGEANPMSHVDACVDRLNEGSWDPAVANTTAYLTGSVFTVTKAKLSRK